MFVKNVILSGLIVLQFCTYHDSDTVVICAELLHDLATEMYVMGNFPMIEYTLSFGGMAFNATGPIHANISMLEADKSIY